MTAEPKDFPQSPDTCRLDSDMLPDMELADLNPESVRGYRTLFKYRNPVHVAKDLADGEFLEHIGAARRSLEDRRLHPTGAGLLMFGNTEAIRRIYPYFSLEYRACLDRMLPWTELVQSGSDDRSGNLYDFFFQISGRLGQSLKVPFKLEGIFRIDDTPAHVALRGALINCLVHADYSLPGGIVILHELDKITLSNPGTIRTGKSQMILGGLSDPRNPVLMMMFNLIRLGERAGNGVSDIYAVWREQHWQMPVFRESTNPFRVELTLPLEGAGENDTINADKVSDDTKFDTLNDTIHAAPANRKIRSLLLLIQQNPCIRQTQLAEKTGFSLSTVKRLMKRMQERKLILHEGARKNGDWKLIDNGIIYSIS